MSEDPAKLNSDSTSELSSRVESSSSESNIGEGSMRDATATNEPTETGLSKNDGSKLEKIEEIKAHGEKGAYGVVIAVIIGVVLTLVSVIYLFRKGKKKTKKDEEI